MASGFILPRNETPNVVRRVAKLRELTEKRAKEKGISLYDALLEICSEGEFSAMLADASRARQTLEREKNASKGWGRDCFARRVEEKRRYLMSQDYSLSGLAAFRKASDVVVKENRHLLLDYRNDVEQI